MRRARLVAFDLVLRIILGGMVHVIVVRRVGVAHVHESGLARRLLRSFN
jgi:hypothetical protein